MTDTEPTNYPDTVEGVTDLLRWHADLDLNDKIRRGLAAGTVEWIPDPSVKGVWGLRRTATRFVDDVVVVVYTSASPLGPDHECNTDWLYDGE